MTTTYTSGLWNAVKRIGANGSTDWDEYRARVEALEADGLTTSDAQAVVDAEMRQERRNP